MKKTFEYHIKALKTLLRLMSQGKYIAYFIPGIVLSLIYLGASNIIHRILNLVPESDTVGQVINAVSFVTNQIYAFLSITLLSPLYSTLSRNLDAELTDRYHSSSFQETLNNILRMITVSIISLFFEFSIIGAWWLFSQVIHMDGYYLNLVIYNIIAAFFYGFAFFDYNLERYNITTRSSLKFATNRIVTMLITGFVYLLFFQIPYFGPMISPVITVMISTIVYLYTIKKLPKKSSHRHKKEEVENTSEVTNT